MSHTEDEAEQLDGQDVVSRTASDPGLIEEERYITEQEAEDKAAAETEKKRQAWARKRAQIK